MDYPYCRRGDPHCRDMSCGCLPPMTVPTPTPRYAFDYDQYRVLARTGWVMLGLVLLTLAICASVK